MSFMITTESIVLFGAAAVALAVVACIYANGVVSRSFVYRDF